jgi:uncharacterized protein YjbJ (UPF0337 family)
MGSGLDHLIGTIKRKAGWLTNDDGVEREGKREQVVADVEATVEDAGDAAHDAAKQHEAERGGQEPAER